MRLQIRTLIVVAFACLLMAGSSQAGGYIGAAAGQGSTEVQADPSNMFDASDTAYKLYGGYRFIKFFGVEADYRDFGKPEDMVGGNEVEVDTTAFDVWAVGVIPIGKFEVFGKAGVTAWEADISSPTLPNASDDGNDLAYGIGGAFKISKIAVRLEFEQFDVEDSENVSMATVGVDWRF